MIVREGDIDVPMDGQHFACLSSTGARYSLRVGLAV
jgi:hypothetical protein